MKFMFVSIGMEALHPSFRAIAGVTQVQFPGRRPRRCPPTPLVDPLASTGPCARLSSRNDGGGGVAAAKRAPRESRRSATIALHARDRLYERGERVVAGHDENQFRKSFRE